MQNWLKDKTGFITGATGWFGLWICNYLDFIKAPHERLIHGEQNIKNFVFPKQVDYIIHLSPGPVHRVIACAKHFNCPVLFTSSGAVYGNPVNEYGMKKQDNEMEFIESGIDVRIARCFTFAGPGIPFDRGYALASFIRAGLRKEPLHIWGSGGEVRTYLYMSDLVDWLLNILVNGESGKTYDVGGDEEITIYELAKIIARQFHIEIVIENRRVGCEYYVPDIGEAQKIGCEIKVPMREAIRKTINYYRVNRGNW